ncbi:MAG: tetratricopeptide repeat protein [Candidatus Zixiibacteriota bacterium]
MNQSDLTADAALKSADESFQAKQYGEALDHYRRACELARQEFNRPVEVEALAQIARVSLIQGNKEDGLNWLKEASAKAVETDPMGWSRYLSVKGRYEWKSQNLLDARQTFQDMYTFCANNNLAARAVDAANMNAIVAESVDDQIEWCRRGIAIAESSDADNWLGPLWNNLGATYYDTGKFEEALDCYLKAREYHWRFSDERAKLVADYSIGMTYRMLNRFDEAMQWLRPSLAWAERLGDHSVIGQTAHDMAEVYIAQGKKSEGVTLLMQARDSYRQAGYESSAPDIWEQINKRIAQAKK